MLHLQDGTQDWPKTLAFMPAQRVLVKSVNDPSKLREAKQTWQALGRAPSQLLTDFRFNDLPELLPSQGADEARRQFFRFIDRTYLEQYAPYVDRVEEVNEYTANSTWTDPARTQIVLRSATLYARVWNQEFRGRVVRSPDGGEGFIPSHCKLVLCNSPVSNWIHRGYFELARQEDCAIGYHNYLKCVNGQRVPDCWENHSGLQHRMLAAFGPVEVLYTEGGPYFDTDAGWRHEWCLGGDFALYLKYQAEWIAQERATPAYRAGLTYTPAHFTQGGGHKWRWYEHNYEQLASLAQLYGREWQEVDVDQPIKDYIRQRLQQVDDALEALHMIEVTNPTVGFVNVRSGPGVTFDVVGQAKTGEQHPVWEVAANGWVRISRHAPRWMSGAIGFTKKL